jgi:hypothetical protein
VWILTILAWVSVALGQWAGLQEGHWKLFTNAALQKGLLAAAIILTCRTIFWLPFRRHEKLNQEFKKYKNQRKPLEIHALPITAPFDNFRCTCVVMLKNHNPTDAIEGVELRLLKFEPPLKHKSIAVTTENLFLSSIRFGAKDIIGGSLKGGQSAHFDLFIVDRRLVEITFRFAGELPCEAQWDRIQNEFVPEPQSYDRMEPLYREYVLTLEATAKGLERNESRFKLSFSIDRTNPPFTLTKM